MWLAVAGEDLSRARQAVHDHWGRDLTAEERAAADRTVDLDAEEAVCPACETAFEPSAGRCPGCGLRLG